MMVGGTPPRGLVVPANPVDPGGSISVNAHFRTACEEPRRTLPGNPTDGKTVDRESTEIAIIGYTIALLNS